MRLLYIWSESAGGEAKHCAAYLQSVTIDCHIEENSDKKWELYVHNESDRARAIDEYKQFLMNPGDAKYNVRVDEKLIRKTALERDIEKEDERVGSTQRWDQSATPYATFTLIALSVAVAIASDLGKNHDISTYLTFVDFKIEGNRVLWSGNIFFTEVWRFFTPMFVHHGWMHIIFNLWWLKDLGALIEQRFGLKYFICLVLLASAISNTLQYYIGTLYLGGTPNFGGMSGVIYALFGFLWIRGKMLPQQGFQLNPQVVVLMILWFFLCFFMPNVANTAHAGGLALGCFWGCVSALRVRAKTS